MRDFTLMTKHAYLCIVTWPDGTEGLLFPRPGHVPLSDTEARGQADFALAKQHLKVFGQVAEDHGEGWKLKGLSVRLVKFQTLEVLAEHVHGQ